MTSLNRVALAAVTGRSRRSLSPATLRSIIASYQDARTPPKSEPQQEAGAAKAAECRRLEGAAR